MSTTARICTLSLLIGLFGCAPPGIPGGSGSENNIASEVLPGDWAVKEESVVFSFDSEGIPYAISNPEDPEDWRTNIEFGTGGRIETPVGALDMTFQPGEPVIDADTGEAFFGALGTGTNITVMGFPVLADGYATFEFNGQYNASEQQLTGDIVYEVFLGSVSVYTDSEDYTLEKVVE